MDTNFVGVTTCKSSVPFRRLAVAVTLMSLPLVGVSICEAQAVAVTASELATAVATLQATPRYDGEVQELQSELFEDWKYQACGLYGLPVTCDPTTEETRDAKMCEWREFGRLLSEQPTPCSDIRLRATNSTFERRKAIIAAYTTIGLAPRSGLDVVLTALTAAAVRPSLPITRSPTEKVIWCCGERDFTTAGGFNNFNPWSPADDKVVVMLRFLRALKYLRLDEDERQRFKQFVQRFVDNRYACGCHNDPYEIAWLKVLKPKTGAFATSSCAGSEGYSLDGLTCIPELFIVAADHIVRSWVP